MENAQPESQIRQILPQDLCDPSGKEEIHVEINLFMKRKLRVPYPIEKTIAGQKFTHLEDEVAQELTRFALEWKRWPIPEHYIKKAFEDAENAVIRKFRELGLCK